MENKSLLILKEQTQKQNRVWVRIASACNNKCIFCLDSEAQNGTLPSDRIIKDKIKKGFKKGHKNKIIISGGEASINPKFAEYIKYAQYIGYEKIQTVTNGNMFASELFCKKVFNAGLGEVTFSFHGHNSTLHNYLVDTPGAFIKSLKGLIYIKKYFPHIILNIDIVVNKINIKFLPEIVNFFMKLGIYEYDILQIIPFGKGFSKNKKKLFYNILDNIKYLHKTWELSNINGMCLWTNRFPVEAFEGYEYLIQDPRKIKSEVMGETYETFEKFILSKGNNKPFCYGDSCNFCFQKSYCHDFIKNIGNTKYQFNDSYKVILGEEFSSSVIIKYGNTGKDFKKYLISLNKKLINIPKCLGGTGIYQTYNDFKEKKTLEDYTYKYIKNLYRKKSLRCRKCKYEKKCEGIHINFIRTYGFNILEPII